MVSDTDLSRAVSRALRHEPWLYELELDEEGWAPVGQLLEALRAPGGAWATVNRDSLERMLSTASKQRHELDGDRIRALYGHSVPGRVRRREEAPPAQLFHGTSPASWAVISVEGLSPMGRQYVHLSEDRETAILVGRRKSAHPVIAVVDVGAATENGIKFYRGNDHVWLADGVPAEFIGIAE